MHKGNSVFCDPETGDVSLGVSKKTAVDKVKNYIYFENCNKPFNILLSGNNTRTLKV